MKCQQLIDRLIHHLEGPLDDAEAVAFHEHLRDCATCRERHRDLRRMIRPRPGAECRACDGLLDVLGQSEGGGMPPRPGAPPARLHTVEAIRGPALRDAV